MFTFRINDFLFGIDEKNICVVYGNKYTDDFLINDSLKIYLNNIKTQINFISDKWDYIKKYTNKYEFVNTPVNIDDNIKLSVCSYKPVSRSYFKMIEILKNFKFNFQENIVSFHLAEGPGGFIEALSKQRKNPNDSYYAMTLIDHDKNIPNWSKIKDFLKSNNNIHLLYGPKGDGDLYNKWNLEYIKNNFENKADFVTADGGFDYSDDFNNQEVNSINLIFSEVIYAIIIQKERGSFILKVFDIFHKNTIEILYLLCYFYENVSIYKPNTSREANSEKYIICINFKKKANYNEIINKLIESYNNLSTQKINSIFNHQLNNFFLTKIQEVNAIYGQQQIEKILCNINFGHDDMNTIKEKLNKIKMNNIDKCKKWCQEHQQPINDYFL